jgi:ABC-type transport system involved in multi-copper enzyme maturation permease subunit
VNGPGVLRSYGAVLRRELLSLAVLPQTYVIAAVYVVVSGVFFVSLLGTQGVPDLERFYSNLAATLVVLVPVISVRGLAEERATGSLDVMLSWPLSRVGVVLGKFTANVVFAWLLVSTSWIYVRVLSHYGSVEVGKQAVGFVGLLALATAFSAVALAISARSPSVAGGAFLAVLVLLAAWSVQYAEGWPLGKALAALSPARRIEAAEQGVLYPTDLVYFLAVVVLGLVVTLALLDRQRGLPQRRYRWRVGALAALAAVVCIAAGVAGRLPGQIDMTPTQRFTLTSASRDIARSVKDPIQVLAFVDPVSAEAVQIRNLYRRYRAAWVDMSLDVVDPDHQPGRVKELGVSGYGQLLVRIGGRQELVDHFGEIALTSAIYRVGRDHVPQTCFTIGHGERRIDDDGPDGYSGLAATLSRIGFASRPIALAAAGAVTELAGCDEVVVAGGAGPFEADEEALLAGYLGRGGRLAVLAEGGGADPASINHVLAGFGVEIKAGTVHDAASLANDPASVVGLDYPSDSPVTRALSGADRPTLVVGGQEIAVHDDSVTSLLRTSPAAWVGDATDRVARRTLAVAVDRSAVVGSSLRQARVAVVGSVEVGANRFLHRFANNAFLSALMQWAAAQPEIIGAGRDPGGVRKIELTSRDQRDIVRRAVAFPAFAAIVPLPLMVRRLKRG